MTNQLLAIAERLIDEGLLPASRPDAVFGGPSRGGVCALCGQRIEVRAIEIELVWEQASPPRTVQMHPACLATYESAREGSTSS